MAEKFNLSLGQRLRAARRQHGWSLGEVETQTGGEFKASVLGAYERGERAISVNRFARLSEVYGLTPQELLPTVGADNVVIDLDAVEAGDGGELVERYLATIQLLRKEPGTREVRQADRAIIGSLLQAADLAADQQSTGPNP